MRLSILFLWETILGLYVFEIFDLKHNFMRIIIAFYDFNLWFALNLKHFFQYKKRWEPNEYKINRFLEISNALNLSKS